LSLKSIFSGERKTVPGIIVCKRDEVLQEEAKNPFLLKSCANQHLKKYHFKLKKQIQFLFFAFFFPSVNLAH
jgi:hypothetical protein